MVPQELWFVASSEDSHKELHTVAAAKMAKERGRRERMISGKMALEPLSLREVAFGHFAEFFESIVEQAQFTPEQHLALGEQLKESAEKRDKLGNCLAWLEAQAELLRVKEKQLAERRHRFEKFYWALRSALHQQMFWVYEQTRMRGLDRIPGFRLGCKPEKARQKEFLIATPSLESSR
jgi:hypothetical protein